MDELGSEETKMAGAPYAPQFDLEPERTVSRAPGYWIGLYSLLIAMILLQFVGYMNRDKLPTEEPTPTSFDRELKQFATDDTTEVAIARALGTGMALDEIVAELDDLREKSIAFEREFAVASFELDEELLDKKDLPKLAASKDPEDRAIFRLYTEPKLSKDAAKGLARNIQGDSATESLARKHALERGDLPPPPAKPGGGLGKAISLSLAILLIVGSGVLVLVAYLVNGEWARPGVGFPMRNLAPGIADRLAGRSLQSLGVFFLFPTLLMALLMVAKVPKSMENLLIYLPVIVLTLGLFAIPIGGQRITLRDIGIERPTLKHLMWGVGGWLANIPLLFIAALIGQALFSWLPKPEHPITNELAGGVGWQTHLSILFVACIVAPLLEEIAFRGTMAAAMNRFMKPAAAILLSGFLFAAVHPTGVPAWPPLMAIGCMAAYVTYRSGSLMPAIILHAVHNFFTLLMTVTLMS